MSGSGSEGAGSGLGPGLPISKNVVISMAGPGGSGWSGYILLFAIGGGKTVHKDILVMTKNRGVHKGKGKTRTYPDHPDPSRVSAGLRTTPYPDPTRTHLDPTRTRCLTKVIAAWWKLSRKRPDLSRNKGNLSNRMVPLWPNVMWGCLAQSPSSVAGEKCLN